MVKFLLLYPAEVCGLLAVLALLLRVRVPAVLCGMVALWGVLALGARAALYEPEGWDFQIFWEGGAAVWRGEDPYEVEGLVNPPTALPLYALLAALPFDTALAVWTALS